MESRTETPTPVRREMYSRTWACGWRHQASSLGSSGKSSSRSRSGENSWEASSCRVMADHCSSHCRTRAARSRGKNLQAESQRKTTATTNPRGGKKSAPFPISFATASRLCSGAKSARVAILRGPACYARRPIAPSSPHSRDIPFHISVRSCAANHPQKSATARTARPSGRRIGNPNMSSAGFFERKSN